ncbi:CDP-diacylglycerol--serine O-phosphatidyltransferase [Algoriphagus vanfongensis]|uniref:CDP-diacylglycerol--serine O-phosphatidyltransferase n=1 Tax=Algoriphagus vanfongensis TaxID=426371 RepID=UPI000409A8B1|nr:CDP-diacylglycerol--serine O-phosphatidyltransferase [Algoriphagus vanfongensis]
MTIKSQTPNSLTLLNLLSGVIGILFVLQGKVESGAYFIFLSAFFDFLDGFAARLLNVAGEIGKQLDSLADLVSFGVLPGFIIFKICESNTELIWLPYLTLILPLLSAYRLAKFNIDTRQSDRFIGLPTPANALFFSTLLFLGDKWEVIDSWIQNPWVMVVLAWIFSILLVSEIPLIALKFKTFSFSSNRFRYGLIGLALLMLAFFGLGGIPLIIVAYLALSMVENAATSP